MRNLADKDSLHWPASKEVAESRAKSFWYEAKVVRMFRRYCFLALQATISPVFPEQMVMGPEEEVSLLDTGSTSPRDGDGLPHLIG